VRHSADTHRNRHTDFTGSRERISETTSCGNQTEVWPWTLGLGASQGGEEGTGSRGVVVIVGGACHAPRPGPEE
jgi:hypothetical protein